MKIMNKVHLALISILLLAAYSGVALAGRTASVNWEKSGDGTSLDADSGVTKICQFDGTTCITIGAGVSGATAALDNLALVQINTSLLSDTADTDSLGTTAAEWLNLYIGDAGKIYLGLGQETSLAKRSLTVGTGGVFDINMGSASGDDFTINTSAFVVEGDTGNVGIGITNPTSKLHLPLEDDAATPTLSFGDGDTGFYETSDNIINVSTAGLLRFQFAGNDFKGSGVNRFALKNINSTATVPNILSRSGDINTGMGSAGADQLSLIAGGVEMLRLDQDNLISFFPTGNVGIGTESPGALLDVGLAGTTLGVIRLEGSTSGYTAIQPNVVAGNTTLTLPAATDTLVGRATTDTLTNKRLTARVSTEASSATPTINTDNVDAHSITALALAVTSMTTNLSGTPTNFQKLIIRFLDNGTGRAITWGASFEDNGVALPTTTIANKLLTVGFIYDSVSGKFGAVAVADET